MEERTQLNASSVITPPSDTLIPAQIPPQPKRCGLYLSKGINLTNFFCILLLTVAANHSYKIEGIYSTLLLQDKRYYDVDPSSLAQTMANYKTIVLLILVFLGITGRIFYQTFSYRCLLPLAALVVSLCIFTIPWGHSVYPGLLVIQFALSFALFIENINPMMVDYVQNRSKGLANSYNAIASSLPYILYSFCYVYILHQTNNLLVPIYIIGSICLLIFLYLAIFVKNVQSQPSPSQSETPKRRNCCIRLMLNLSEAWIYCFKHKEFLLIFLITVMNQILNHISSGAVIVYISKYIYFSDINRIANHTKYLGISNLLGIMLVPLVGYFFDRYSARFLFPLFYSLASATYFAIYFYSSFTSPFAFSLQISAKLFISFLQVIQHASLALHTPQHLKAGIFSISSILARLGLVIYEQMSGPILDSTHALVLFLIGAVMSGALGLLFLLVALCCDALFKVQEPHQRKEAYQQLRDNIRYK